MTKTNKIRCVLMIVVCSSAAHAGQLFPEAAGEAKLAKAEAFDSQTIYDYMDGAADPYMNYAFQSMHHALYDCGGKRISVEVYDMKTSAEAYGMFSNETQGKLVPVGQGARFDGWILTFWQGRYVVKVSEVQQTGEAKEEILSTGRAVAGGLGPEGPLPDFLAFFSPKSLAAKDLRYFHKDHNLNNFQYVSTANVLNLSAKTECVLADCTVSGKPVRLLLIRFPSTKERDTGYNGFCNTVLSSKARRLPDGASVEEMDKGKFTSIAKASGPKKEPLVLLCFDALWPQQCQAARKALGLKR